MEIISVKSALKNSGTGRVGSTAIPKFSGRVRVGYFASLLRVGSISGRVITRHIPSIKVSQDPCRISWGSWEPVKGPRKPLKYPENTWSPSGPLRISEHLRTSLDLSNQLEDPHDLWNPSKPLEVPKVELSGAISILRHKEFEAVQCVPRDFKGS